MRETWVWSRGREDPLEKGMATHSSILAWEIPWTEEPGGLHSKGLQRVRRDWATEHNPIYINAQLFWGVYSKWLGGDSVSKIQYLRSFRKTLWGIFHHWALSQAQLFLSSRIKAGQCLPLLWSFPGESESNCNQGIEKKKKWSRVLSQSTNGKPQNWNQ